MIETMVMEVIPSKVEETTNYNTCFGWNLRSCEPICEGHIYGTSGTSVTHTKDRLIFDRDTNLPNYDILKRKYNEFSLERNKKERLEKETERRSAKFWLLSAVPAIVAFIIILISMIDSAKHSWGGADATDIGLAIFVGLFGSGCVYGFVILIAYLATRGSNRAKYQTRINKLEKQMDKLANEAKQYL